MKYEMTRKPTTIGEMLVLDFMPQYGLTQRELAERMGYEVKAINRLINGKSKLTLRMAQALSKEFGNSAEFWMNCQRATTKWLETYGGKENA